MVVQRAQRSGEDHLTDLGCNLEAHHVQGRGQLRVEVQGEVAERRQAEQRHLDGVEQLDDGHGDGIVEHAAQADAQEHHRGAQQQRVAHADLAHDDRHDTHHGRLEEHLERIERAVCRVADFRGGEQGSVIVREHLLVEHGVEGVGQQHEYDEHPQGRHLEDGDHFLERWVGRSGIRVGFLAQLILLLGRNPEQVDAQHTHTEQRADPEVEHRVDVEQEAGAQGDNRVAEGAPGA